MGFVSTRIRSTEFVGPLTGTADTASFTAFALTASYVDGVGYLTGSSLITASITGSTLEFIKGDGTTLSLELPTSSFSGSGVEGNFTITDGNLYVRNSDTTLAETGSVIELFGQQNSGSYRFIVDDDGITSWTRFSLDYKDIGSYIPQLVLTMNSMSIDSYNVTIKNTLNAPAITGSLLGTASFAQTASFVSTASYWSGKPQDNYFVSFDAVSTQATTIPAGALVTTHYLYGLETPAVRICTGSNAVAIAVTSSGTGETAKYVSQGVVNLMNYYGAAEGDTLYVNPQGGNITHIKPSGSYQVLGYQVYSIGQGNMGQIYVNLDTKQVPGSLITSGSTDTRQVISGSLQITQNLDVLGTASFAYVTASQTLVKDNTITVYGSGSALRKAGLIAADTASIFNSGSWLFDLQDQQWQTSASISASRFYGTASIADAITGSLVQNLRITGSVLISGSLLVNGVAPGAGGGATVTITGSAPSGSKDSGSLWWNSNDGNLYIQVTTPTGSTYVPATNTVAGGNYGATLVTARTGSTWNINHNFNSTTPLVTVYSGSNVMIPADILSIDANNTRITFSGSVSGTAVLSTGIGNATTNNAVSASFATSASIATSASFARSASFTTTASFAQSASVTDTITSTSGSGLWVWSMGNPTTHGWTLAGSATWETAPQSGIILTTDTTNQSGTAFRSISTAYFTNNDFVMTINAKSSGSLGSVTGGDGVAMYMGAANTGAGVNDGLTVFLDEYNNESTSTDSLKIFKNSSAITTVNLVSFTGFLDNNRWRKLTSVVTGPSSNRTLTVLLDDIIVWRGSVGAWTPTGTNYGVWGFTGGARNHHAVNMVNLQPAKMWMMSNGLL